MHTIHVAGFQTVAIFMQNGVSGKSTPAVESISDAVKDTPHKVCIRQQHILVLVHVLGENSEHTYIRAYDFGSLSLWFG